MVRTLCGKERLHSCIRTSYQPYIGVCRSSKPAQRESNHTRRGSDPDSIHSTAKHVWQSMCGTELIPPGFYSLECSITKGTSVAHSSYPSIMTLILTEHSSQLSRKLWSLQDLNGYLYRYIDYRYLVGAAFERLVLDAFAGSTMSMNIFQIRFAMAQCRDTIENRMAQRRLERWSILSAPCAYRVCVTADLSLERLEAPN